MKYKEIELVMIPKDKYVRNIQSFKGKSGIFAEIERDNKFDNEAIKVMTKKRDGTIVFLGYVKKNDVEKIYTDEAEDLYYEAQTGEIPWSIARRCEDWAKIKEFKKTPIWSKQDLENIFEKINNNEYVFIFDYDEEMGNLHLKSEI